TATRLAGVMMLWPVTTISIAIAHSHFHVRTFRSAPLNRLYEFVLFYQSGMPSYGWQLNHNIGHHQHFMQQGAGSPLRDEYYWLEPDGSVTPRWRYLLRTVGLAYWYAVRNGHLRPDYLRKFALVMALHAVVLAALLAHDPLGALICFVAVIVANMFVNTWFSYSHHAGLSLKNRYAASYSNLDRLVNLLTFNTGYHTAHHIRASVHWYELPSFHATIADRVPAHCYLTGELTRKAAAVQFARTREAEAGSTPETAIHGAAS
ncbi:MAG TPA: fatty acid desaturase, partial [Burkholderiaceae bacterium]|nr:fatty acid desaturase [Burkholderiaceae bacterium]